MYTPFLLLAQKNIFSTVFLLSEFPYSLKETIKKILLYQQQIVNDKTCSVYCIAICLRFIYDTVSY